MNRMLSAATTVLVIVAGYSVLSSGTDGWTAWTSESARRLSVVSNPVELPNVPMSGVYETSSLHQNNLLLVDFIYTQCPTVCWAMGAEFRELQSKLESYGWSDKVKLLSVTFDPENDDLPALANYLDRFSAIPGRWDAARFDNDADLNDMLNRLGVVVIPEPVLGFVHNTGVYLIDQGRTVGIYDFDDHDALLKAIQLRLES